MHFVAAALGRDCDDFTLHIYASLAEAERRMISERTKAGLARSHKPLGLRNPTKRTKAFLRRLRADRTPAFARPHWSARKPIACTSSGRSRSAIDGGVPSPSAGRPRS